MSYVRNYLLIAFALYGICEIKYFFRVSILWKPWQNLKTTNLFIMHYTERLYARTKKALYKQPQAGAYTGDLEDVRERIKDYGLRRDRVYGIITSTLSYINNIFGISRWHKRNLLAVILTIVFTKRDLCIRIIASLYRNRGHYHEMAVMQKFYAFLKKFNTVKVKQAGVVLISITVVILIGYVLLRLKDKYGKKASTVSLRRTDKMTEEGFEKVNILQNELGIHIISMVNRVRAIDQLLFRKDISGFKAVADQGLLELHDCHAVLKQIKDQVDEIKPIKEMKIYWAYNKYSIYALALIDLTKEERSGQVLKKYEEILAYENTVYDEACVKEGRRLLYDYLKQCMAYYNTLDAYLIKANKRKRRLKKKLYQLEQMQNMKTPVEVIEHALE